VAVVGDGCMVSVTEVVGVLVVVVVVGGWSAMICYDLL
jgi:hypothetical protein